MVEVIIDGKEYEGKKVKVLHYGLSIMSVGNMEHQFLDKETPKQSSEKITFFPVPKEIQFVKTIFDNQMEYYDLGLRIGNVPAHILVFNKQVQNWEFITTDDYSFVKKDHVLVPCKREEFDDGDWAFSWFPPAKNKIEELLNNISNYCLIIGKDKEVRMNEDGTNVWVTDTFSGNEWFKVVSRNEAEKL